MAYRKIGGTKKKTATKKKKSGKRRAKVGAINVENMGMTVAGVGLGAILARLSNTLQASAGLNLSPGIMGALQIAIGLFGPNFSKSQFVKMMGYGFISTGVVVEAVNLGLISGVPANRSYQINGTPNLSVIGRTNRLPRVAGTSNLAVVGYGQPNSNRISNVLPAFNGVF